VLIGRLDDNTIGQEIVGGKLYSTEVRTGTKTDTTYIALEPPNGLVAYYRGYKIFELLANLFYGYLKFYDSGTLSLAIRASSSGAVIDAESPLLVNASTGDLNLNAGYDVNINAVNESHIYVGTGKYCVVHGNLSATGTKPARQITENYGTRELYARESPDVRYVIEGKAQFVNGECRIELDPIFLECIEPNTDDTLWIPGNILPLFEPVRDVFVSEIGDTYFVLKEPTGQSNAQFFWNLSAVRKGYAGRWLDEVASDDDVLTSNWEDELL